jgi:hypothetical protein
VGLLDRLRTLASGSDAPRDDDLLDQITLRQRVADGIVALRQYDRAGKNVLPAAVEVVVTAGPGSVQIAQRFVDDPAFDAEVEAQVANAVVPLAGLLPYRTYRVEPGERPGVEVRDCGAAVLAWVFVEGRPDGACPFRADRTELRVGRGPWHGTAARHANDLCLEEPYVGRAAFTLRRSGAGLLVEPASGQAPYLAILRADGHRVRPGLDTVGASARIAWGERIELSDGARQGLVLCIARERPPAGSAGGAA